MNPEILKTQVLKIIEDMIMENERVVDGKLSLLDAYLAINRMEVK